MAELVKHRVLPSLAGHDVGEHAHVPLAIDVDAERVLALALPGVEVAALEHGAGLEADAVERRLGESDGVAGSEERVDVHPALDRHLLEERVGVVPGRQVGDRASEPFRQPSVDAPLPARERLCRCSVDLVERRDESLLVHLRRREGESEPVAVAHGTRCLVPEACELANVVRYRSADRLRCLPRLASQDDVAARAENLQDLVVVDASAGDDPPMDGEHGLDGRLELDDPRSQRCRHLIREKRGPQKVEAPPGRAGRMLPCSLDRSEALRIGEEVRKGRLDLDPPCLVLATRQNVEVPRGNRRGRMERCQLALDPVGDGVGARHHARL